MSAAHQIIRNGGIMICATECSDGLPSAGRYKEILESAETPTKLLEMINDPQYNQHDQWQVQIQAQIQQTSDVYIKSDYLSKSEIRSAHLESINNITSFVESLVQDSKVPLKICVLPEGPQTIPYVQ